MKRSTADGGGGGPRPQAPAAGQALDILTLLASRPGPVAAAAVARELGLPRSTTYHLLGVLVQRGYVMHLAETRRYGLGVSAHRLGTAYARQQPLSRVGRVLVAEFVDRIRLSAHLAVLSGREVVYLVEERAAGAPALVSGVDVRLPAQSTASGRAMLAALPRAQLRALYPGPAAFSPRSDEPRPIRGYSQLRRVLDETRNRGYAVEDGDVTDGLASVAVPVLDHAGWPIAALAATFPRERLPESEWGALAQRAEAVARELARRIEGRARGRKSGQD